MKSKLVTVWLSLLTGTVGSHWFYLGHRRAWVYLGYALLAAFLSLKGPQWLYMLLFGLSFFVSSVDTLWLGLMTDEKWNARFNPDLPVETRQSSGLTVTAVALALGLGVAALMTMLALVFQWYLVGTPA